MGTITRALHCFDTKRDVRERSFGVFSLVSALGQDLLTGLYPTPPPPTSPPTLPLSRMVGWQRVSPGDGGWLLDAS